MNNLPKRDDDIYEEIENFKDYELTQCIAYEMSIRSSENLKAIKNIIDKYNNNYSDILSKYQEIEKQINEVDCIGLMYYDERLKVITKIINELSAIREKSYRDFETSSLSSDKSTINKQDKQGYSIYTNLIDYGEAYVSNGMQILNNFKRPKLNINPLYSRNITAEIDLSRPLDEILAYVSHIKKDLEKNKDILKAPIELFELLGIELQKADDISKMCVVNKNEKELCFDGRQGKTRTQKLADMFYIYDMVKEGSKELRIRSDISKYYEDKFSKTTDISDTTFRKYRDIAKDYIDNQRYKELLTGVKS